MSLLVVFSSVQFSIQSCQKLASSCLCSAFSCSTEDCQQYRGFLFCLQPFYHRYWVVYFWSYTGHSFIQSVASSCHRLNTFETGEWNKITIFAEKESLFLSIMYSVVWNRELMNHKVYQNIRLTTILQNLKDVLPLDRWLRKFQPRQTISAHMHRK